MNPENRSGPHQEKLAQSVDRLEVEGLSNVGQETGVDFETPFFERSDVEQADLFFQIDSLLAKRTDNIISLRKMVGDNVTKKMEEAVDRWGLKEKDGKIIMSLVLAGYSDYAKEKLKYLKNKSERSNAPVGSEIDVYVLEEKLEEYERDNKEETSTGLKKKPTNPMVNGRVIFKKHSSKRQKKGGVNNRVANRIDKKNEVLRAEIKQYLAIPDIKRAYKQRNFRKHVHYRASYAVQDIMARVEELEANISYIKLEALEGDTGEVSGVHNQEIELLKEEKAELQKILDLLNEPGTIGPVIRRIVELGKFRDSAQQGRMIEIGTVAETVDDALSSMRERTPFMLAGHLGGGKTDTLKHAARIFMLEQGVGFDQDDNDLSYDELYNQLEPEIFSGSSEASVYDLVGKLKLTGKDLGSPEKIAVEVKSLTAQFKEQGIDIPFEEVAKVVLGQGSVTETIFNYGPLGRALRDGKPLIVDEINMLPPEVISRINDIMLAKVGSKVRLQENGEEEFEIKPGFVILSTLNVGSKYAGTKEFNAAFGSRWVGKEMYYPTINETFDLILSSLMRKDSLRLPSNLPEEDYAKLVDLSVAVREVQDLFSGNTEGQRFMNLANGVKAEKSQLEKVVISPRDLMRKIIVPWKNTNFDVPLDDIIAQNILSPAGIHSKDDQKFIAEVLMRRGFFADWTEEDFNKVGINGISQAEIDALVAAKVTDEYQKSDIYGEYIKEGHVTAKLLGTKLLIGNLTT